MDQRERATGHPLSVSWMHEVLGSSVDGAKLCRIKVARPAEQYGDSKPTDPREVPQDGYELQEGVSIVHLEWDSNSVLPTQVAVKLFTVATMTAKYNKYPGSAESKAAKLRSRMKSREAECTFYRKVAPIMSESGVRVPAASFVESTEDYFQLVMTCDPFAAVRDLLGPTDIRSALSGAAAMHSVFWDVPDRSSEKAALMEEIHQRGAFWTQEKHPVPSESEIRTNFDRVLDVFADALPGQGTIIDDTVRNIGNNLIDSHPRVTAYLKNHAACTLIHGDLKLANLMWSGSDSDPLIIDWEWVGIGPAAEDLAYLIASSAQIDCIKDGADAALLEHYYSGLSDAVRSVYSLNDLTRDYELCLLDLFRWMICNPWSSISMESVQKMKNWYGRILPNRSIPHVAWMVKKVGTILTSNPVVALA